MKDLDKDDGKIAANDGNEHVNQEESVVPNEEDNTKAIEESQEDDEAQDRSDDDGSSASEQDDDNDDDDDEENSPSTVVVTDEHGHPLSEYEIQRLERIRRNREYLASLGLERNKPSNHLQSRAAAAKRTSRKKPSVVKRRSSISRATKAKPISYSERRKKDKAAAAAAAAAGTEGNATKAAEAAEPPKRKENRAARMERFIYDEFKRIGSDQKWTLKRAEKFVRAANVECKIAKQRADKYENKRRKQLEVQQLLNKMEQERRLLGGFTAKEMLHEVDSRMFEIFSAMRAFDERFNKQGDMIKWAENQEEARRKMEIIDAMDRFPKALKDSVRDLDMLLLERSPKDPPPPRRGTRKRKSMDDTEISQEPKQDTKVRAVESPDGTKVKLATGEWGSLASAITAETLSSSARANLLEKPSPEDGVNESGSKDEQEKPKKKKTKRELIARNVGGWVSPAFSQDIDRSWLQDDSAPKKFDLSTYVPQIGDTVLYYPAGHRKFLKVHPDFVGKKTRNITRLTLWDRAKKEKGKLEKAVPEEKKETEDYGSKSASKWWNDEWLSLIDGDLDRYPILCRVEKTHAEFPPDPFAENKVVTKDGESGGVQVSWAVKIDTHAKKRTSRPPLCLAVLLHPLTTVLPPCEEAKNDVGDEQLSPPPNFYVVTFPSKASPFVVPFSWAYRLSHSFSVGSAIRLSSKTEWRGKVKRFRLLHDDNGTTSSRLDDKIDAIRKVLSDLKSEQKSLAASLEEAISKGSGRAMMPIADACAVIDRFDAAVKASGDGSDSSSQSTDDDVISMMQLVRSTFPLWKEVVVESGIGKKLAMSAWELSSTESKGFVLSGPLLSISADIEVETGLVHSIDQPLRAKIECTIEDFLKDTPDAAMFCPLVTDEDAPSYSCAVPRGMAFGKILRRLRVLNKSGTARCYYRSIDSLLGDISAIVENCVLYNSPDSFVVEKAQETVSSIKRLITQVASRHFKEKEAREKLAEERRQSILLQCNAPTMQNDENVPNGKLSRNKASGKRETLVPYTEFLYRSWIQDTEVDASLDNPQATHSVNASNVPPSTVERMPNSALWVPQSGDTVLYSRSLHADFVKGHHPSLTTYQCALPRFLGETALASTDRPAADANALTDSLHNRWLVGTVVSVRASFPRQPTKRDSDYEQTFEVASPVLTLGIKFDCAGLTKKIYEVSWRPCLFGPESPKASLAAPSRSVHTRQGKAQGNKGERINPDEADASPPKGADHVECRRCHLCVNKSFIRPAWTQVSEGDEGDTPSPYLTSDRSATEVLCRRPPGLTGQQITSIDRCLNVLKRRCLEGIPATYVDPKFTTENVKKGWCPPSAKAGKSLPSFDRLLAKGNTSSNEASTRGIEKLDQRAVALLAEANYLPRWTSALSDGANKKTSRDGIAQSLALHETLSPSPNLCLELVQARLRNGYYRSRDGLAHDIEEAYVSSILLLLAKPSTAKQGQAVSIRRIAKALSTREVISSNHLRIRISKKGVSSKKDGASSDSGEMRVAKNGALSESERNFVEKIDRIRKLYGMALACATETDCMERILGTIPRKKATPKAKEDRPVDDAELAIREARQKLGFIYYSLQRDMCNNRPQPVNPNPSIQVRIRFTGQQSQDASFENRTLGCEQVDMSQPILIEPTDYENNHALLRVFFGKPGMVASCGRCSAYGRSALICRVRKNHSQPDFDWAYVFRGTGGISGLLHMLRTGQRPPEVALAASAGHSPSQLPALENDNTTAVDESNATNQANPPLLLEQAEEAVSLANRLKELADRKSRCTARLSEEFIRTYFPVDPSDGHYNYCILCGLIGDIICCEGCPNVAHPNCVNLDEIPDEDWFCATCQQKKADASTDGKNVETAFLSSPMKRSIEAKKESEASSDSHSKDASNGTLAGKATAGSDLRGAREGERECEIVVDQPKPASAGEYVVPPSASAWDFLDEDMDRLEGMLTELKSLRPIRPKKPPKDGNSKENDGDESDGEEKDGPSSAAAADDDGPSSTADDDHDDGDSSHDGSDPEEPANKRARIRVGTKIKKKFGNHGHYIGTVLELPTEENPFYLVRYEDDDEEDMEGHEVRKYLLRKVTNRPTSSGRKLREERANGNASEEEPHGPAKAAAKGETKKRGRSQRSLSPTEGHATATTRKKKRGRPKKPRASSAEADVTATTGKKRRGRPKKTRASSTEEPSPEAPVEKQRRGRSRRGQSLRK